MFEVPAWGNDIPKNDEVTKLFTKKKKRRNTKSNAQPTTNNNVQNRERQRKTRNINVNKKTKNKANGHINLSKDDHIKNRILRRSLNMISAKAKNNYRNETDNTTGKVLLNGRKILNGKELNNKVDNKIMQKKGKVLKPISNSEIKEPKKSNNIDTKQYKGSLRNPNDIDKEPKLLNKKQAHIYKGHDDLEINNADIQNLNTDELSKILINAKRKKLNDKIKNDDIEDVLFGNEECVEQEKLNKSAVVIPDKGKIRKKKEKIKKILKMDSNRNAIRTSGNKLRERMLERLKAAQFRYLNEKLYTSSGSESQELFKSDPAAFHTYHEGYQLQIKKWPVNPLELIIKRIQKMPKTHLIADMGCGEAALSKRVFQSVRSFDLVASAPGVEVCNMAHTPLLAASMDAVVFCLALMGTNLTEYLLEANRVLKIGGHLLIAEVESRFENVDSFSSEVQRLGFSLKKLDESHQVFFFMEFNKVRNAPSKRGKLPTLRLKPCLYKRR